MRRRILLAPLLLLSACATLPPPAPPAGPAASFSLRGRISVQYDEQSMSGQLDWRAGAGRDEVLLSSPLGQGLARINRDERGATLLRPGAPSLTAEDIEMLSLSALGFRLPLAGLRYWIQAASDPARAAEVRRDAAGGVEQIAQDGWKIDYLQYRENRPRKIRVTREGLEIRLVIDQWQTN